MIAVVVVGALLGAVLFALLLRLAPPTAAPLVQLAHFDAGHDAPATAPLGVGPVVSAIGGTSAPPGGAGRGNLLTRVQSSSGWWLSRQLTRRGIGYTSLRQDLALTGR
ncbi:MAG TPA: hypothetical protein PLF56_10185, partial [Micropruina sp.]|nr:hypothetical protein [Micropruina sp.]